MGEQKEGEVDGDWHLHTIVAFQKPSHLLLRPLHAQEPRPTDLMTQKRSWSRAGPRSQRSLMVPACGQPERCSFFVLPPTIVTHTSVLSIFLPKSLCSLPD